MAGEIPPEVPPVAKITDKGDPKVAKVDLPPEVHLPGAPPKGGTDQKTDGYVNGVQLTDGKAVTTAAAEISTKAGDALGVGVPPGHKDFAGLAAKQLATGATLLAAIQGAPNREAVMALAGQVHSQAADLGNAGALLSQLTMQANALGERALRNTTT